MSAVQVVLDEGSFWALVVLTVVASVVALVAAVAAWRSARASRSAVDALANVRRELVVPEQEWRERSSVPRRAEDAVRIGAEVAPRPPRPPAPVRPAPRTADTLIDPDRPSQALSPAHAVPRQPAPPPPTPVPESLRTEPLSAPRGTVVAPPTAAPAPVPAPAEVPPAVTPPPAPSSELPRPAAGAPAPPGPAAAAADPAAPARPADPNAARLKRLEDPDPFVRIEAIEGLRGHPMRVEALMKALHDEFPVVRRQAVRALKDAGGPEATRALLEVANEDPSAEVREEAVMALGAMLGDGKPTQGNGTE